MRNQLDGGLEYLGLVVDRKGAQCATKNGDQLKRQGLQNDLDVAAVEHIHAKDAAHGHHVTNNNDHERGNPR